MEEHLHALPAGQMLHEYRVERVIGSGGFGITYFAWDTHLDKPVAIKEYLPNEFALRVDAVTVRPKSTADQQDYQWGLERFLDEARTLARFRHHNLNEVYRFFEAHGTAYLVLEYIEGETLSAILAREGKLEQGRLNRLLEEMLSGLNEVHRAGFVHRDVKPGNIMIRTDDGSAVLLDFGAARQAIGQRSQAVTSILTPGYAPIEQYDQKADDVGPWTDIYALGMVAYRCISGLKDGDLIDAVARGRMQYKGQTSDDMRPAASVGYGRYSDSMLHAIDWAIRVSEDERPRDTNQMLAALQGTEQTPPAGNQANTEVSGAAAATRAAPAGGAAPQAAPRPAGGANNNATIIAIVSLVVAIAGGAIWYILSGGMDSIGDLEVSVNVPQAQVSLDGRNRGTASQNSPLLLRDLPNGDYRLEVSAEGYQSFSDTVDVSGGSNEVEVELERLARQPFEPEMVALRGGSFQMGCVSGRGCQDDELPVRRVTVGDFQIAAHEVTFDQWDACVSDGGCNHRPDDRGWGRGNRPVINVGWRDAQEYTAWLKRKTGKNYRLLSEAEWEYAARAGTTTPFGIVMSPNNANYEGTASFDGSPTGQYRRKTTPVGSFAPNAWGIYDMHGNVWEVLQDCWHENYRNAPSNGSAWETGGDCNKRVVRSGAWNDSPDKLRSANRYGDGDSVRDALTGLRLAITIDDPSQVGPMVGGSTISSGAAAAQRPSEDASRQTVTPPPPPPPPTTGELVVRSNVSGDTVRIDGRDVGPTSPNPHVLQPGNYTVMVSKPGYLPTQVNVNIVAGETRTVRVQLLEDRLPFEPEMVGIRGGSFSMGCRPGNECQNDEQPVHRVTIAPFEVGKFELTFDEWDACVADGGCSHRPDERWGRGRMPVINVGWRDAQQYLGWLNRKTGKNYRLLSESEWEYMARAGTTSKFNVGSSIHTRQAAHDGNQPKRVGSFSANAWGVHDVHGNVWELVEDCWHDNYLGAPNNGSAWTRGGDCNKRVVRGGAFNDDPDKLRSANRYGDGDNVRDAVTGLRIARSL